MKRLFLIVIFILSNFYLLIADNVQITTLLDSSEISKNYLYFKIKIKQPQNIVVNLDNFEHRLDYVQQIGKTKQDTTKTGNTITVQHIYKLFVPDNDTFELPSVNISYTIGNDVFYKNTKPIKLSFGSIKKIDLDKKYKPIKENEKVSITFSEVLPFLLGTLGVILLVLLVLFFIKKRKKNEPLLKVEKPKIPAHKIAFDKLEKLENQKLWQNGQDKKYHIQLTEILKEYIENRFNILSLEQTTNDLISDLKKTDINSELINEIQKALSLSDLVKFAKMKPLPEDNKMCFENTYKFIDKTK